MDIQHEILSFDANTGSILVRYFSKEVPDGLSYNIDLPVEGGVYPDSSEIEDLIVAMRPVGQLRRATNLKSINVPPHLILLPMAIPVVNSDKQAELRDQRNVLLAQSDWTQLTDAPLTDEERDVWVEYRQELRDLPEQEGFPDSIILPVFPQMEPR